MATSYSLPSDTPLIKQVKLNSTVASNVSPPPCDNTDVALSDAGVILFHTFA